MAFALIATLRRAIARLAEPVPDEPEVSAEKPEGEEPKREIPKADLGPRFGFHGQEYLDGLFAEEYHADLKEWTDRVARLNELRIGDSVVVGQLLRIETPIQQAEWTIQAGDEPEPLPSEQAALDAEQAESMGEDGEESHEPGKPEAKPPAKPAAKPATPPAPVAAADAPAAQVAVEPELETEEGEDEDAEGDEMSPEDEAADLAKRDSEERFLRVVRANLLGDGPREYRMRTGWTQYLRESLTALHFGVSVFERTYRAAEGPLGSAVVVDGLYWLHPRSIDRWHVGKDGELLGVTQWASHSFYTLDGKDEIDEATLLRLAMEPTFAARLQTKTEWQRRFIPAPRLVVHVRNREGSNFEGIALTRHMYGDAKHSQFLRRAQRIDAQKRAISIPRVKVDKEAPPDVITKAIEQAKRMRAGGNELSYVVDTPGVETGYVDMTANVPDLTQQLRQTEERIALLAGTEFSRAGSQGAGGTLASSTVQASYFNLAIESVAEWLRESTQRQVLEPLAMLNIADAPTPKLEVAKLTPSQVETIIAAKQQALLTWTAEDEQSLRRQLRIRLLTEDELQQRAEKKAMGEALAAMAVGAKPGEKPESKPEGKKPGESAPAPVQVKPPAELADTHRPVLRPTRREPTERERRFVSLADLDRGFDLVTAAFVNAIKPLRAAAVEEALEKMRVDGTKVTVPRLKSSRLRAAMLEIAERAREIGRRTAQEELSRQVHALRSLNLADEPKFDILAGKKQRAVKGVTQVVDAITEELETVIGLDVQKILDIVVGNVQREMLRGLAAEMSTEEAEEATRAALAAVSDAELEKMGRELASRGINGGRAEMAEAATEELEALGLSVARVRRSEVLDARTCGPCESLDGLEVEVDSDEYFEFMPPAKCEGHEYCRGVYELVVEERSQ